MAHIEVTVEAGIAVVLLLGEHDLTSVEPFTAQIERLLDSGSRMVVDLTEVLFVDSTVVAVVVEAHRHLCGDGREHDVAAVITPNTGPRRTWSLLGLDDRVPTFATRREAITAVRGTG